MNTCFYVSSLHGNQDKFKALLKMISQQKPDFVFLAGNSFPCFEKPLETHRYGFKFGASDILKSFHTLKLSLDCNFPEIFLLPGKLDERNCAHIIAEGEKDELWRNMSDSCIVIGKYRFYGFNCLFPDIVVDAEQNNMFPCFNQKAEILFNGDDLQFGIVLIHMDFPGIPFTESGAVSRNHETFSKIEETILKKNPYILICNGLETDTQDKQNWKKTMGRTSVFNPSQSESELTVISFELHQPGDAIQKVIKILK